MEKNQDLILKDAVMFNIADAPKNQLIVYSNGCFVWFYPEWEHNIAKVDPYLIVEGENIGSIDED